MKTFLTPLFAKKTKLLAILICAATLFSGCGGRHIRTAEDITPGNLPETELNWQYGANDIRIQTTKLTKILVDHWFARLTPEEKTKKPRLIITEVSNLTNSYIPLDMVRDIIESVAINDGRFSVVVGNAQDAEELNRLLQKTLNDPKYSNSSRPKQGEVKAPQLLGKIRLTMAQTEQRTYDIQDWRMSITLYDIETQEAVDSSYDILRKKIRL